MIRLVLINGNALYRQVLSDRLRRDAHYDLVGEFDAFTVAAPDVSALQPDILLLDAGISPDSDFCQQVRSLAPSTRVVLLGVGGDLESLLKWIEIGVDGFVTQDEHFESLTTVIEVAARGDFAFPRKLVGKLVGHFAGLPSRPMATALTDREVQVVTLLERGYSNKEIAHQLGIEVATTKNHVHHILEKLQIRRRSEVAAVMRHKASTRTGRNQYLKY